MIYMKNLLKQLAQIGINNPITVYHNLSYDELFKHEPIQI